MKKCESCGDKCNRRTAVISSTGTGLSVCMKCAVLLTDNAGWKLLSQIDKPQIPEPVQHPVMKPYRVIINGQYGAYTNGHVMALDTKSAFLRFIEDLPADHPLWQAAGWNNVNCFPEHQAFKL